MRENYNLDDIIEWDVSNWSLALEYWGKNTSHDLSKTRALEIGSGKGGLSLWMALNGAKVLCTDLHKPGDLAIEKHKKYNVENLIDYQALNVLDIQYIDRFDIVFFKSVLGGIGADDNKENQINAIHQMYKCLKKGGELFFAENLVASPIHHFLRKNFILWGKKWRYVSIEEMLEMLSVFSDVRYITVGFLGAFGRNEWQRKMLGAFDKSFINFLVPIDWRYIMIGIAKK